jgi:hypothetical protein
MPQVNGYPAETGCYVEGHWGQYGPDHLADQASAFGWEPDKPSDDPRIIRHFADLLDDAGYRDENPFWEYHTETGDEIIGWLNAHTDVTYQMHVGDDGLYEQAQQYVWHWRDGEVFLSPTCEDGDCDDDTCAHWD